MKKLYEKTSQIKEIIKTEWYRKRKDGQIDVGVMYSPKNSKDFIKNFADEIKKSYNKRTSKFPPLLFNQKLNIALDLRDFPEAKKAINKYLRDGSI